MILSHVTHIGEKAFDTFTLEIIEINENSQLHIDANMFHYNSDIIIFIPYKPMNS